MKLIIDINENVYTRLFDNGIEDYAIVTDDLFAIAKSIRNATPLADCTDAISRSAVIESALNVPIAPIVEGDKVTVRRVVFLEDILSLPSVNPTRPKAKWIRQSDDNRDYYVCEKCGIAIGIDDIKNYCPNCGAEMESE